MSKNQKGFSVVEGLLILVIAGILGGAGWYVYSSNKRVDESLTNADKSSSTKPPTEIKPQTKARLSDAWLVRESSVASIHIPDGFNVYADNGEEFDFILPDSPQGTLEYKKGTLAKVVGVPPPKHFELGLIVAHNGQGFNDRGVKLREFKTYSGLNVEVKLFEQTTDPDGVDFPKGARHLKYRVLKGNDYINVDYAYLGDGYIDVIDEMVKTANIK